MKFLIIIFTILNTFYFKFQTIINIFEEIEKQLNFKISSNFEKLDSRKNLSNLLNLFSLEEESDNEEFDSHKNSSNPLNFSHTKDNFTKNKSRNDFLLLILFFLGGLSGYLVKNLVLFHKIEILKKVLNLYFGDLNKNSDKLKIKLFDIVGIWEEYLTDNDIYSDLIKSFPNFNKSIVLTILLSYAQRERIKEIIYSCKSEHKNGEMVFQIFEKILDIFGPYFPNEDRVKKIFKKLSIYLDQNAEYIFQLQHKERFFNVLEKILDNCKMVNYYEYENKDPAKDFKFICFTDGKIIIMANPDGSFTFAGMIPNYVRIDSEIVKSVTDFLMKHKKS